ncbi:heat shock protein [Microbacteriaceae bacterium MWH-Ta3]|jgi:heat shock protein HtpX|nr:heat shock protein [Microbacteriaceae bacterium MWH-Ta3]
MYSAIAANKRNTVLIIGVFLLIVVGLGWLISQMMGDGSWSITIATVLGAGAYAWFQYYNADKIAVAMAGAQQITEQDNPRLWRTVENLTIATGMPMPRVYIVNDPAPNAFASGRDPEHAVVAATTGLLDIMTDAELEGVMAHELGHVKNYDIRVSTIVFGLVVAVGFITDILIRMAMWGGGNRRNNDNGAGALFLVLGLVAMIVAPLVSALIQAGVSRQREYLADATGAMTTRNPEGLASALHKLAEYKAPMRRQSASMAHLWISDPMKPGVFDRMFATHPPIPERIRRLLDIGGKF